MTTVRKAYYEGRWLEAVLLVDELVAKGLLLLCYYYYIIIIIVLLVDELVAKETKLHVLGSYHYLRGKVLHALSLSRHPSEFPLQLCSVAEPRRSLAVAKELTCSNDAVRKAIESFQKAITIQAITR